MLSITGLSLKDLEGHIAKTNKHLPDNSKIGVSLHNGPRAFVVTGPSRALYGLAAAGNAPAVFLKTTKSGVPWVALIPSGLVGLLGLTALKSSAGTIFNYFVNLTSTAGLMCWLVHADYAGGWEHSGDVRCGVPAALQSFCGSIGGDASAYTSAYGGRV